MISLKKLKESEFKDNVKITLTDNSIFIGKTKEWQQPEEEGEEYNITIIPQSTNAYIELKQSQIKSIEIIK